jgi:hypothetical protein
MPGIGWETIGPPASITMDFSGRQTQFYLFRFRRGNSEALELWGVWRNGDVVPLDYQPDQVLNTSAPPALHLQGRRRSATEIVACVIVGDANHPPNVEQAIAILKNVFQYHSRRDRIADARSTTAANLPPIEWGKTPPSWRAVYAAALRGNEREDAARDIIVTIPMDKLSSEERALIEAK